MGFITKTSQASDTSQGSGHPRGGLANPSIIRFTLKFSIVCAARRRWSGHRQQLQAGSAQGFSPRSAPIRWAQAKPLKATALSPWPGKQESPTQ